MNLSNTSLASGEQFYSNARFATGLICYPIICLVGLTSNVLTIVILNRKSMETSTNVYLVALAVSDIVKLLNDLLYFIVMLLYQIGEGGTGDVIFYGVYPFSHYIFHASATASAWLIVGVATERYILICHPLTAQSWCTMLKAKLTSAAIFLACYVVCICSYFHYYIESGQVRTAGLWENYAFATAVKWTTNLLRSIIPVVVLVVLNGFIIHAVHQTRANRKLAARNRITVTLIVVIVVFIISYSPDAVMCILDFGYAEEKSYWVKGVREITDLLMQLNPFLNFFLYSVLNVEFRKEFYRTFPCLPVPTASPTQARHATVKGGAAAMARDASPQKQADGADVKLIGEKNEANGSGELIIDDPAPC